MEYFEKIEIGTKPRIEPGPLWLYVKSSAA